MSAIGKGHLSEIAEHLSENKGTFERQRIGHLSAKISGHLNENENKQGTFERKK